MADMNHQTETIHWGGFLAPHDMTWARLPTHWHEGAFLGNGVLGAMIYADPAGLRWDVSRRDITELSVMKRRHREPTGRLVLQPVGKVQGAEMRLDLWNAEARSVLQTDRGEIRWRSFVHAEQPLLVIEVETAGEESGFQWAWHEERVDESALFPNQPPLDRPRLDSQREQQGDTTLWSRPFLAGGEQAAAWREMRTAGNTRVMVLSIAFSRPETTARQEAASAVADGDVAALLASHRAWWHGYYPLSFLSIPDARLEGFYWAQMYKLGSATRADRPALDTLGPWWTKQAAPAIAWDLHVQLGYSPVYAANRLELGESLCRLLDGGLSNLIRNVPEKYQADSAAVGRLSSDDCNSLWAGPVPESGKELCNLPCACFSYWKQYRYSMDDALLRERLFPLLRRSIHYYLHLLKPDEQGRLHLPEAISPEYRPAAPDTNIDLALLRWGCRTLLWACERLKLDDPLRPRWQEVLEKLADPPVDENGLMIGRGVPLAASQRRHSHLFAIYPLRLLTGVKGEDRALMAQSFDHWINLKGGRAGGSYAIAAAFCACLGRPEAAVDFLNEFLDRYPTSNTMYLEGAPKESGLEEGAWLDTPLAAACSVQEMLLRSGDGMIHVFPAVPKDWPEAAFHQLRAEGAFLVSAARRAGRTQFVRVTSLAGEPCRIRTGLELPVKVIADREVPLDFLPDGSIGVHLRRGETAVICSTSDDPVPIEPVVAPPDDLNTYGVWKVRTLRARRDGSFRLLAAHANRHGENLRFEQGGRKNHLTNWASKRDWASWELLADCAGAYRVELVFACPPEEVGSVYGFNLDGTSLTGRLKEAQGTPAEPYVAYDLGTVQVPAPGRYVGSFRLYETRKSGAVNVFKIQLVPVRAQAD